MAATERIEFRGHSGGMLAARLDRPQGAVKATALFAHCFTCSKDIFAASRIAAMLSARGIAVLRFDFTGLGASEGEFANTNFSSNVEDLLAAAEYLREKEMPPVLLIGHSLGGAAVLAAASKIKEAAAVATIGAPSTADHVIRHFGASVDEIEKKGVAEVTLAGRKFHIEKQFLDDVANQAFLENVGHMKKALLVCHAPMDETVGIDNATDIFLAARHPKSFLSLDSADHLLRRREDAAYAAEVIAAWASRYVDEVQDTSSPQADEEALEAGVVEVSETRAGKFTQRIRSGKHVLTADEPEKLGGNDTGPGPYEFVLAGLGTCTAMTVRMYADRKEIPLDRVSVQLSRRKIDATECSDCTTEKGEVEEITREISLEGDLDESTRTRLLEIANKCPVHRTLSGEIKIRSSLVSQPD